jgi:hemerythrin-like domain-containing protein
MADPVAVWHAEHVRFAQLLDFLDRQMQAFHAGGHPNYDLMRDVVQYLHDYGDRYHHPREDIAFGRLAEYDSSMQPAIRQLRQEHRVLAVAGAALLKQLDNILEDVMLERAAVESAAATYLVYFRRHLNTEEASILPRAKQLLARQDWDAVAAAVPDTPDPLFGEDINERYRELRRQIAGEAQAD